MLERAKYCNVLGSGNVSGAEVIHLSSWLDDGAGRGYACTNVRAMPTGRKLLIWAASESVFRALF